MTERQEIHATKMRLRTAGERLSAIMEKRNRAARAAAVKTFWKTVHEDRATLEKARHYFPRAVESSTKKGPPPHADDIRHRHA